VVTQRAWHAGHETSKSSQFFCSLLDSARNLRQNARMTDDRGPLVLVVGDVNPDLVLRGDVVPRFGQAEQLLDAAELVIGGSAGITAHGFARLGRAVSVVAAVGTDTFGTTVTAALAQAGVDTSQLVVRPGQPTGVTVVLSAGGDRAILTLPGVIPTLSAAEVRAAVALARPKGLRHVHVCSLFLQPTLAGELPDLLAEIRTDGVTTSLDTNDDPAAVWKGVDELLPALDLLLPNRSEALALSRAMGDPAGGLTDACRNLARRGPLVVVKDGPDGARAGDGNAEIAREPGHPADVVDATGAGDSFNAAFLDGWLQSLPVAECLRRGVVAGAVSVSALGGTAAQPSLDLLLNDRRTP
jgi:sugar/nucleoside kinase (ribokinase family)